MLAQGMITRTTAKSVTNVVFPAAGLATAVIAAVLSGCSMHGPAAQEVSTAVNDWHRPAVRLNPVAPSADAAAQDTERPARPDTINPEDNSGQSGASPSPLQAYVQEALERNPTVMATAADAQANLERIAQVTALPDPILRMIVRPEPVQTAAGDMYFTLGVGQKVPLPAKLDRAGRAAVAEVRMAIERLNAARLRVIADVEHAYYRLYLTERSIELTEAHRQSLENLEQVLASQYRVGKAEQQDLLRIQTEIARLRDHESRLGNHRASAAAALNQLLDRAPRRDLPATTPITLQAFDAEVEQLIALAAEHNPELAILTHQAERDREAVELARLAYWPDPTVGFEWTYVRPRGAFKPPVNPETGRRPTVYRLSETGHDNWAVTLQVNVPIWLDRIEAAKREARQRAQKTQHERHAALNRITFRVYDAWVRVQTQQDTIRLLKSTLIPQARQTYDVSLTAYQSGTTNFLTVIDNWRQLLDFELMLHREVAHLETAFSELQREVGLQLIREQIESEPQDQGEQP